MTTPDAPAAAPVAFAFHQPDLLIDLYQPVRHGDWELRLGGMVLTQGYCSPPQLVPKMVALLRGDDMWMSITPLEVESQAIGIAQASGHVVIFGLGLGWAAAASALRPQVTAVTVVERDPDVLALHDTLNLFSKLPGGVGDKVRIVPGDALSWWPDRPVDVLMPDIWLMLVSDGRVDEVRRMQANVAAERVYFWGQEIEIARHARAAGRPLDAAGIAATLADFDLPLIGPEVPGYPALVAQVAERWMHGRWLPDAGIAT